MYTPLKQTNKQQQKQKQQQQRQHIFLKLRFIQKR